MSLYKNVLGANQHLGEHRFLGPNEELDLTENDLKLPNISKAINLGWLIPVENIIKQEILNTSDNTPDLNVSNSKAVEEAIKRAQSERVKEEALKKALGNFDEENVYIHRPVMPGQYGNIEHNTSQVMTRITVPPDINEGITEPSALLDKAADAMYEAQMKIQTEVPKPAVKPKLETNKVAKTKVVRKTTK